MKTKLVLAITAMVCSIVASFSYVFISQIVRSRINEAAEDGEYQVAVMFEEAKGALDEDLTSAAQEGDERPLAEIVRESVTSDAGLNRLLDAIIGYSGIAYDAAITDGDGKILLDTNPNLIGQQAPNRELFASLAKGGFWRQVNMIYGPPRVYDVRRVIVRDGKPLVTVRVGLSTTFMKSDLRPQLNRAVVFSMVAIVVSMLLAAVLSNFALRPLVAIGKRLDRLTAGQIEVAPEKASRKDEFGVVSTKIDRIGRQMRDVQEVFSALKENLDQLMANLQDGLILVTRERRIVLVSASAEQFVGRARSEMLGCDVTDVFTRATALGRAVLDAFNRRMPIAQADVEERGRRIQIGLDFIEQDGQDIGALLTMRDAESVRRIEDEIELSRRLAAIGRLTSGVAHEVKNPINAIVVHLEILREKLSSVEPGTQRHIDVIGNEIRRLDRVVQTLVDFTRPVELRLSDIDLQRIIDEVVLLASPEAKQRNVSIERHTTPGVLPVKVDADLVKQALLNVVINGVQAMPDGGTLKLNAARYDSMVELEIADTGNGIPPDIRDKIFNLYFTTKQKGSGIGLAMTYRVMQLHNGSIEFESAEKQGTTFRLRFPSTDTRTTAQEEATARS